MGLKILPQERQITYLPETTGGGGGGGGGVCWQELSTAEAAMRVRIAIFMCVGVNQCLLGSHPPDSWQRDFPRLTTTFVFANKQMRWMRKLSEEREN